MDHVQKGTHMGIDQSESDQDIKPADIKSPATLPLSSANLDDPCHDYGPDALFVQSGIESGQSGHYTHDGVWIPAI